METQSATQRLNSDNTCLLVGPHANTHHAPRSESSTPLFDRILPTARTGSNRHTQFLTVNNIGLFLFPARIPSRKTDSAFRGFQNTPRNNAYAGSRISKSRISFLPCLLYFVFVYLPLCFSASPPELSVLNLRSSERQIMTNANGE